MNSFSCVVPDTFFACTNIHLYVLFKKWDRISWHNLFLFFFFFFFCA